MTKALIIGGGIAGPVTAVALQRADIESVVYEAYPANAGNAGAFLTVAVNGLDALRALDLHQPVMELGFSTRTIELVSGTGKRLGVIPIGGVLPDGTTTHTIKRADLYRVLYEITQRRGIEVQHGKRLVDAEVHANGAVTACFEDGTRATGDLLIGADGIHSRTRRIIDPAAPAPRHLGLGNVGGFTRTGAVTMTPGAYVMTFGKRAFFGYVVHPSGEIWWFANPPSARRAARRVVPETLTSDQWKARLIDLFTDDAGPTVDIIRSTTELVGGTDQYDLPKVPTWYRGPMIVIGDAAHAASPSSGQGASMAIEDALVLAKCLRDLAEPTAAFQAFERLRRPRVERVVAFGARSSSNKAPGPVGRVIRDLLAPFFLKLIARQSQDWLFGYHIDWDDRVRLGAGTV
ncbi:MAG TPA: FAD-dependent monooxygenase [Gemmatimonadales bacterium]|nr:FAD-dependent monooxygenase [Gemmatimonadales bacterium]